jgi:3-hydroxyisobutyrate dehydrogenase-like beta-hydroxyacid dehydrogenase
MRVGFAGLGAMGAGIAQRIAAAGHPVTVWNRTRARAEETGLPIAASPAELAQDADVLFTMLTNTDAVEAVAEDVISALRAPTVWADLSTIAPDASVALAERVKATGARFLDCPVSGSPATLAAGQMSVMAGGEREAFERIQPVLQAIGPKVTYIGPNGHAILTRSRSTSRLWSP